MVQDFMQLLIAFMPQALHVFPSNSISDPGGTSIPKPAIIILTEHNYSDLKTDLLGFFCYDSFFNDKKLPEDTDIQC